MLRAMKAVALGFITIACCAFVLGAWPAFAQEKKPFILEKTYRNVIAPDMSHLYAQYYVPYGILAAASNNDVTKLDDGGIDSIFTNEYVGSEQLGENIRTLAVQSTKPWHYEFNCYGLDNDHCDSAAGPPFQVWTRMAPKSDACDEVSIAFAGTRPFWTWQGIRGWLSNGRVANTSGSLRATTNSYNAISTSLSKKITTIPCYTRRLQKGSTPVIVSVGHSLGAGLAEFAALANSASSKNNPSPTRIEKVFAFDPSAETGGDLIEKESPETFVSPETLKAVFGGLEIDRVVHYGEVLSGTHEDAREYTKAREKLYRTTYEFFPPWNQICDPMVRNFQYLTYTKGNSRELHEIVPLTAALIQTAYYSSPGAGDLKEVNKPLIPQTQIPRPTKLLSGELCATRYERTDPKGRYQEAYPPPPSETLVSELGARPVPQSPVPTQQPNLGLLEALFAPAYAHAADTGGRQGHHALLLTELARATRPQVQLPVEARAADLGARGRFYALAQTQSVELNDRQALFASAYLPAANLGARRASSAPTQSQLSDRDARPALISTPSWR